MAETIPRLLTLLLAVVLVAGSCGPSSSEESQVGSTAPGGPKVLLIVVDTLRRDHLGCYGYPRDTSPGIDALAAVSTRYTRAFSQAPWTTPSIGSLLSSRSPSFLGIRTVASPLPQSLEMLPETLKQAGYATGAIISHTFCSARWNFDQGFDLFDENAIVGADEATSPLVTKAALEYLEAHAGEPFFLWLHLFDPHNRYRLHPGFDFPPDEPYDGPVNQDWSLRRLRQHISSLGPRDMAEVVRYYDSEIAFTDHHIAQIMERLHTLQIFDDTLIIFTADHGEAFLDHRQLGHTSRLYQELVNVPLIVKYPHGRAGIVDTPVALLDIYPTILETVGLPPRPELEGISLLSLKQDPSPRFIFTETSRKANLRGIISGPYKFILDLNSKQNELYDLLEDPGEQANLASQRTALLTSLASRLNGWMARQARLQRPAPELKLTDTEIRRLRSLGYIGDDRPRQTP